MAHALETAEQPSTSFFMQARGGTLERTDEGRTFIRGLKVFRTGNFKNSKGVAKTWTADELDAMVTNFDDLRDAGSFIDVPVRTDHSQSVNALVGYVDSVKRDGDFLLADVEFTEPDAADRWERGTFRSRSLEVTAYETNDGIVHYPVVQGLAFVDIGAVEGLHRKETAPEEPKETPVSEATKVEPQTFTMKGVSTSDYPAVQAYIVELEGRKPADPATHTFKLHGVDESDFAKVQSHVDSLEASLAAIADGQKAAFVKQLATDGKILATAIEETTTFAKSLSTEQYASWAKTQESVPTQSVFASHGTNSNGTGTPTAPGSDAGDAKDTDAEVVENFRRAGMSEEFIKNSEAGRRLAAAAA